MFDIRVYTTRTKCDRSFDLESQQNIDPARSALCVVHIGIYESQSHAQMHVNQITLAWWRMQDAPQKKKVLFLKFS